MLHISYKIPRILGEFDNKIKENLFKTVMRAEILQDQRMCFFCDNITEMILKSGYNAAINKTTNTFGRWHI